MAEISHHSFRHSRKEREAERGRSILRGFSPAVG